MKATRGFWLPDEEEHLVNFLKTSPEFAGGPTYQLSKYMAAMPHVKNFRHAIDVGAHCGLWSRVMARMFTRLSAFEPVESHRQCWVKNMPHQNIMSGSPVVPDACLYPFALSDKDEILRLRAGDASTGDTRVHPEGSIKCHARTLDSFDFTDVDFIKIDCEGFEKFVLDGGEKTVMKYKPTMIVEQKRGKANDYGLHQEAAVSWAVDRGAKVHWVMSGDFCMGW